MPLTNMGYQLRLQTVPNFREVEDSNLIIWQNHSKTFSGSAAFSISSGRRNRKEKMATRACLYENVLPRPPQQHSNGSGLELGELLQPKLQVPTSLSTASQRKDQIGPIEQFVERIIVDCRFFTLMAIIGTLTGSLLCFLKGCSFVIDSFCQYFHASWRGLANEQLILLLVQAVDVYLVGTVMLIFGLGLFELFVSSIRMPVDNIRPDVPRTPICGSSLFGLFQLEGRPSWLEIHSLDELKTKVGHVVVMALLVGMFERSKRVSVNSGLDLVCFSASILLSSCCLFLLSKLNVSESPWKLYHP